MALVLLLALTACDGSPVSAASEVTEVCGPGTLRDDGGTCVPERCGAALHPDADVIVAEGESIQAAADALGGGTIGLGAGTWREALTLGEDHGGSSITGRCPELTILDGSDDAAGVATLHIDARPVQVFAIASLTVTGGAQAGVLGGWGRINLTDLDIVRNSGVGLSASGFAELTLTRVVIRETLSDERGSLGYGMQIGDKAVAIATDVGILDNAGAGLVIYDAELTGDRLSIERTVANREADGLGIYADAATVTLRDSNVLGSSDLGMTALRASNISLDRVGLTGNSGGGITVQDAGTSLVMSASDVSGNGLDEPAGNGVGIQISAGAVVSFEDVDVIGNSAVGVLADGVGTTLTMTGGSIRGTIAGAEANSGVGLGVQRGASANIAHVSIDGNTGAGILAQSDRTTVEISDSRVTGTQTGRDGINGTGVLVDDGAQFSARGLLVEANHEAGMAAIGGASLEVEDAVIRGTLPSELPASGVGFVIRDGSWGSLRRSSLTENYAVGAYVEGEGSTLTLDAVVVSDTRVSPESAYGIGISALIGATLLAKNVEVRGGVGAAVAVQSAATVATLEGLRVSDLSPTATGIASALSVAGGATLHGADLVIENVSPLAILTEGSGTVVELEGVVVRGVTASPLYAVAMGVSSQLDAVLTLRNANISEIQGPALRATEGGTIGCTYCSISATTFAGVVVDGGHTVLVDSDVSTSTADLSFGGGVGAFVSDRSGPGTLSLHDTRVSDNALAALWIDGENTVDIHGGGLVGGLGVELREGLPVHGNAIFARSLGEGALRVHGTALSGSWDAGVLLEAATATFDGATWSENGVDVVQQVCGDLAPPEGTSGETQEICRPDDRLTLSLSFDVFLVESAVVTE